MQCVPAKGKIDICPPQTIQETNLSQFLTTQIMMEDQHNDEDNRPAVEVIDLSDNQVLLATSQQETAVYKCPESHAQEHPLRGISRIKIAPECSLDLALGKISLQGQIHDDIIGSQFLRKRIYDKDWLPLTQDLLFGKKSTTKQPEIPYQQTIANYVGGTMIAVALLALLCILTIHFREFYKKRSRQKRRRRQNMRSPTRLIVRNVPDM
jgi:hypothetical protein